MTMNDPIVLSPDPGLITHLPNGHRRRGDRAWLWITISAVVISLLAVVWARQRPEQPGGSLLFQMSAVPANAALSLQIFGFDSEGHVLIDSWIVGGAFPVALKIDVTGTADHVTIFAHSRGDSPLQELNCSVGWDGDDGTKEAWVQHDAVTSVDGVDVTGAEMNVSVATVPQCSWRRNYPNGEPVEY